MRNWQQMAGAWLWPVGCLLCGAGAAGRFGLCAGCMGDLPVIIAACPRCGLPGVEQLQCVRCARRSPAFQRTISPLRYACSVSELVQRLKFRSHLAAALTLGELLADAVSHSPDRRPEVIVPVPLHAQRLRRRGFNQAVELARPVAARLSIPIDTAAVLRVKATAAQASLASAGARRRNLRGAFRCRFETVPRHVAVLDDVMTTGSTVSELARALLARGVERVDIWVCARAVPDDRPPRARESGG